MAKEPFHFTVFVSIFLTWRAEQNPVLQAYCLAVSLPKHYNLGKYVYKQIRYAVREQSEEANPKE